MITSTQWMFNAKCAAIDKTASNIRQYGIVYPITYISYPLLPSLDGSIRGVLEQSIVVALDYRTFQEYDEILMTWPREALWRSVADLLDRTAPDADFAPLHTWRYFFSSIPIFEAMLWDIVLDVSSIRKNKKSSKAGLFLV